MKCLLASLILTLFFGNVYAQGTITGTISERSNRKNIEFATVLLLKLPDSTSVKGTATDKKGKFVIDKVEPGNYFLKYSFIGFTSKESAPFLINPSTPLYNAGNIELANNNENLKEVVVTGRKSMMNTGIDRKIYNVEQDIISSSGSASDILKNIPSVEVDIDGLVSLRGSADVLILINGKPSPLMGSSRADVLQQLPANSIERIEVITNPSARYKPDGTSGIINIVLKKNIRNGFNGTLNGNVGNRERKNANINLNYRPKKVNLFLNYGIRHDTRKRFSDVERYYYDSSSGMVENYNFQKTTSSMNPFSHILSGGIDYTINENNSWGISANYYQRKLQRNDIATYTYYDGQNNITEKYVRLRFDPETESTNGFTAFFNHIFPGKEDHELNIEFNHSMDDEVEDNHYTTTYSLPTTEITKENTLLQKTDKESELTIDYTNPITEESKIELGYNGSFATVDADLFGEYFDEFQNNYIKDITKSNHFIYKENVHALYATYQQGFEKWGYSIGARAEQVFGKSYLVTLNSTTPNQYFNFYPTLHLSYKLGEESELQLNYSKRVNRPDGDELNPFPEYQDPRNLYAGNPKLRPEFIHSVEFGYKWQDKKFSVVPSLYYRYRINGFTTVTIPLNDTTLLTTEQNLSSDQSAGLELIFSAKPGKVFSVNVSSNLFYNKIDASNLGFSDQKDIVSMSTNLNSTFNLTKNSVFQVSANYRSARLTPQGKSYPAFVMNSGFRQNLLNNKVSLTFTASDIFNTQRQKNELNTPYFKQNSLGRRDGRIFYLGVSYRFGIIKKDKEEKLQFDDSL